MLLHLLKNIADLPVNTSMVKQSGLGKLVGSIEKHRICSGPNATNIQERVDLVKSSWKASVKARKIAEGSSQPASKIAVDSKRQAPESSSVASPSAKRPKVSDSPSKSSLSSLLTKMSGNSSGSSPGPSAESKAKKGQTNGIKIEVAKPTWKTNISSGKKQSSRTLVSRMCSRFLTITQNLFLRRPHKRKRNRLYVSSGQTILVATWLNLD